MSYARGQDHDGLLEGVVVMEPSDGEVVFECQSCKKAGNFTRLSSLDATTATDKDDEVPGRRVYSGIYCPKCGNSFTLEVTPTPPIGEASWPE